LINSGVKERQGPHQLAEKYRPTYFPVREAEDTSLPSLFKRVWGIRPVGLDPCFSGSVIFLEDRV